MALIQCDECGSWVSDKDKACPNCGYPMKNVKRFTLGKRGRYAILGVVLLSALAALAVYMHQDLAKKEAEAKAEVEKMRKELQEQRTRDSLALVHAEEERLLAEQKAAEEAAAEEEWAREEQGRIEAEDRMRREGVERVVTLTRVVDSNYKVSANSNYGGEVWDGMFHFANYAFTKKIRIPNGCVWIYKRSEVVCGHPRDLHLFYFSRDQKYADKVEGNKTYRVADGGLPVFRSGDKIRLAIDSYSEGEHTMNIYFTEKDENYYY